MSRQPIYFESGEMNKGMFADISINLFFRIATVFFSNHEHLIDLKCTYIKIDVERETIIFCNDLDTEILLADF